MNYKRLNNQNAHGAFGSLRSMKRVEQQVLYQEHDVSDKMSVKDLN